MPASKAKRTRTKKATKADLEAKIAQLEAKLSTLSAQVAKPAETRAPPSKVSEVAPAPKVKYTGENYYRTRQRLAYHPPDKQFRQAKAIKFEKSTTVAQVEAATSPETVSKTAKEKKSKTEKLAEYEKEYLKRALHQKSEATKPAPPPEPQLRPEPKKEKPKRTEEVIAPKVKYTGENYYRTRQRLAYHPPDKQFRGGQAATAQVAPPKPTPSPKQRGTMPSGWKK